MIKEHDSSKAFFLYLTYQSVHSPAEVSESEDAYDGKIANAQRKKFAGMLTCEDEGIGNVTDALHKMGMMDNTIIVFTSDNGEPDYHRRWYRFKELPSERWKTQASLPAWF